MPQFSDDSRWRRSHPNDPATTAESDQILAGAHDRMNDASSFVLFSTHGDGVEVSAVIEPEATSDDSEHLMRMMAYTLTRMWCDNIENDDIVTQHVMILTFVENMSKTLAIVLREKGIVE